MEDTERLRRAMSSPVVLSSIDSTTSVLKDMSSFWVSSQNKTQLEMMIYSSLLENYLRVNENCTILTHLSMESSKWNSVKIQDGKAINMQSLQLNIEEADLRFPIHVLDCVRSGYKRCVVISNDTDVIVTLLFHFTVYAQEGLEQLWVKAGVGKTTRFIPIHSIHQTLTPNLAMVLPALHSLAGCDITSKIGTKKAALKADPIKYLLGFGVSATMNDSVIKEAEHYLVNVVDSKCRGNDFNQLRTYHFHRSKSSTLHNLPPTSQGLEPHIQRAYCNA